VTSSLSRGHTVSIGIIQLLADAACGGERRHAVRSPGIEIRHRTFAIIGASSFPSRSSL
jgi:hypothetical protein